MQQDMTYTFVLVAVTPETDPLFRSFIIAQPFTKLTFVCGSHSYYVHVYISCIRLIQSISSYLFCQTPILVLSFRPHLHLPNYLFLAQSSIIVP